MSGIYIHIPFCKQACSYCDFYFVTQQSLRDQFVDELLNEINGYKDTPYASEPVETIYFGGGTPSRLKPEQIESVILALKETFLFQPREITLEMNPDDVTKDYLCGLKQAGINRASMGVQTFQPALLKFMNRAHTREEALTCLELLSSSGFETFTVDLIYGNPNQSQQQLSEDLDLLLNYSPPHISAYSLTVEPDTRLGKQVSLGRISPPKDDAVADQFTQLNERLVANNIHRYEVSNYSKSGAEAIHNSNYWQHENYLGFGPGAHSFWWDEHPRRWQNEADIKTYLNGKRSHKKSEELSLHQLAEERIMLALRTRNGLSVERLKKQYGYPLNHHQKNYLNRQEQKGMLHFDETVQLSDQGILLADAITLDLITMHG